MVRISVLMSVYNTEPKMLKESIDSILAQTCQDWEMILINDCSTDIGTLEYLAEINDPRIFIYENKKNLGLTASLIKGLALCKGKYIARMDADDISVPFRFEKQMDYLEKNQCIIIGSYFSLIPDKHFKRFFTSDYHKQMVRMMFGNDCIIHSSAFWDKQELIRKGINYNPLYLKSQDYGLWCDCLSKGINIGICPESLVRWRESENQITKIYAKEQMETRKKIRKKFIKENYYISDEDLEFFVKQIDNELCLHKTIEVKKITDVLNRFISNNKKYLLEKEIYRYWFLQAIMRIKYKKKFDLLFTKLFWKSIWGRNFMYILKCLKNELYICG